MIKVVMPIFKEKRCHSGDLESAESGIKFVREIRVELDEVYDAEPGGNQG